MLPLLQGTEELGSAAMLMAALVLVLVEMAFDFVGTDFALVGEVGVPAARMMSTIGEVDEFGDDGLLGTPVQTEPEDLAVATPELLHHFFDLEAGGSGGFENEG